MSWLTKLIGGHEEKVLSADPWLEQRQTDLYNYDPGLGFYGRRGKQIGKALARGDDVSDLGELTSIGQMYAAEQRDIGDNFGYGANALIAASGGPQANILERQKQIALDRSNERKGMAYTQGVLRLREQAASDFANARQSRISAELAAKQAAMNNRLGYYGHRYNIVQNKGLFPTLAGMAADAGQAYGGQYGFGG